MSSPRSDAARVPERMAGGDGLRGLAEAHVVGEQEAARARKRSTPSRWYG